MATDSIIELKTRRETYEPSLGAHMWVQVATDFGKVLNLIPEEDRSDVLELLPELWSEDKERADSAADALYEIIDDPKMTIQQA